MKEKAIVKLGDVLMDAVVNENPQIQAEVTDNPIEKGENIADHMKEKPYTARISGSIVNNSPEKITMLRNYVKESELLKYVGRNVFTNVVITLLDTKHNADNAKGFDYDITLKHVKIAYPETFKVNIKNPVTNKKDVKTQSKIKNKTNVGRKQVMER